MDTPRSLCPRCRYHREVPTRSGAVYHLCERSRSDASFPRYPRWPVTECRGFERDDVQDAGS